MATLTPLWTAAPTSDPTAIAAFLAERGIAFEIWPLPAEVEALAGRPTLSAADKEAILAAFARELADKAASEGYESADVIALRPDTPDVEGLLARFDKVHYHDDDEVRAILAGSGTFGFVGDDGRQFLLEMHPGEFISLPAGMWHWFFCEPTPHVTALRLFKANPSWEAHYRSTARGGAA